MDTSPNSNLIAQIKLLVSVRTLEEAEAAILGGADIIDIKEPNNGSLGAASLDRIEQILNFINGRNPVTAALGEMADFDTALLIPRGLAAVKLGLAGARKSDWRSKLIGIKDNLPAETELVAVAYADSKAADSPSIQEVSEFAISSQIRYFLIDTYKKTGRGLFEFVSRDQIHRLIDELQSKRIATVLAGSLSLEDRELVISSAPSVVGVRTAVCTGGRQGVVSRQLVKGLKDSLSSIQPIG